MQLEELGETWSCFGGFGSVDDEVESVIGLFIWYLGLCCLLGFNRVEKCCDGSMGYNGIACFTIFYIASLSGKHITVLHSRPFHYTVETI